jgi:DNA-binding IclR family transcriptional regulator
MSQTAERTFVLLEHAVRSESPCGLVDLANRAGLDKSTTARLLTYLEKRGLLVRDDAKRYSVGPAMVSLAALVVRKSSLVHAAQPLLDRLRDESGETVSLHVRVGDQRVCIAGAESRHAIQRVLTVGEPVPLWLGPTGQVILAHLNDADREAVLARNVRAIGARRELGAQVSETRARGWLATVGGRTRGVAAASAPVFDARSVIGSITIAGPEERWTSVRMTEFAPRLRAAADELSTRIGGAPSLLH